ncbi:MAG: dehydrogenase [Chryseobacterium sp.]|nr:MAG: dehydrogenase [Chryseobacterium sp.]
MNFDTANLSKDELLRLYRAMLLPRTIEEKMLIALRQGKISKWFSSWGQEATSAGSALAMAEDEYLLTVHRNLAVFTARGIPLQRLFSQFQGKMNGFTKGRDRSFHFGTKEYHIVGMISHLASQMGVANGIALSYLLNQEQKAALVYCGDGGASEGDFHEAINTAAVWQLPLIIIIENNQWGLSTPSREQFRCASFADKGIGYGIESLSIDGNNIVEVYSTVKTAAESIRQNPRPILIECNTFRVRGHEEASGTAYYPDGLIDEWTKRDPISGFEKYLLDRDLISQTEIDSLKEQYKAEVDAALEATIAEPDVTPDMAAELKDVYADFDNKEILPTRLQSRELRFIDAVSEALDIAMQQHPSLVLMGQDIAEYGGAFKVTQGLVDKYGKERVRNTPLCEAAIIGSALGLSINGYKSMVEMQFADFVTEGFNQIINNLAKSHYRWGANADVVIRMPTGAGTAAGPFHSQSNEAWFAHTPGLRVVYPAFPEDAKGLLLQSFADPNPVMFFEHKKLYRSLKGNVPEGYYTIPFGKARVVKEGSEITVVTYGLGVHMALAYADAHPKMSLEIIDLRTLAPLDTGTIFNSVKKTGKAIVLHEDTLTGGFGGELAALIAEHCFTDLDAPVMRAASMDTPIPFNKKLEDQFLPDKIFHEKLQALHSY